MTPDKWNNERTNLKTAFANGEIVNASRQELERYLVVLANTPRDPGDFFASSPLQIQHASETKVFSAIIRHLLTIRLGQELLGKSHEIANESNIIARESKEISRHAELVSRVSAGGAIVSVLCAVALVYVEQRNNPPSNTDAKLSQSLTPLVSTLQPTSSMKTLFPASNYASNADLTIPPPTTNSAAASPGTPTNR
jgi:hypothetical protein